MLHGLFYSFLFPLTRFYSEKPNKCSLALAANTFLWFFVIAYIFNMNIASLLNNSTFSARNASTENFLPESNGPWSEERSGMPWSTDEAKLATQSRAAGESWGDISRKLPGCSPHACSEYYRRKNPLSRTTPYKNRTNWTPEETTILITLAENRTSWGEIGSRLGRGMAACRTRYYRLTGGGVGKGKI
jgi:hypothetical protein